MLRCQRHEMEIALARSRCEYRGCANWKVMPCIRVTIYIRYHKLVNGFTLMTRYTTGWRIRLTQFAIRQASR